MASPIKICTRIVYLAAALFLVLGTMSTFPSCQAGGCCPGGPSRVECSRWQGAQPCRNDACIAHCAGLGHKKAGAYCLYPDCCCKV
ncbi:hypothetical protein BDA96_05G054200 [Sorghum bicolor]|uniref:Knottin scorpion toxin-like domain-containing protein n=2 Tax=Sorghum bicolor TaxID=4558 RepID=A0A921UFT1_SORBI|nr:hypothetical protein SORBI_3005G051700 [Sorghum bicolor]KAG0528926.1 hypothetical protein BDA96_05G054200 [Sorghum bicolor]